MTSWRRFVSWKPTTSSVPRTTPNRRNTNARNKRCHLPELRDDLSGVPVLLDGLDLRVVDLHVFVVHGSPMMSRAERQVRRALSLHSERQAAARTIAANCSARRLAPPTSAPSSSGCDRSSLALSGVTLPPYWMRVEAATSAPSTRESSSRMM